MAFTIEVFDTPEALDRRAALWMAERMGALESPVIGLATGSTPIAMYEHMVALHREGKLDFANVRTFNLDEYVGLAPTATQSYHYYMDEHLFRHVNVNPERTHIPKGDAPDPDAEARAYADLLRQHGPIDVQVLGIGTNAHIGFNEPGTSFDSRTQVIALAESTRRDNTGPFGSIDRVPTHAITVGIADILEAREILLLAKGASKAEAIQRTVEAPPTEDVPASALQRHGKTTLLLDREAAAALT